VLQGDKAGRDTGKAAGDAEPGPAGGGDAPVKKLFDFTGFRI